MIPMPYKLLGAFLLITLYTGFVFTAGWKECSVREQAKQKEQAIAYAKMIVEEQKKGNEIATKLITAEERIKVDQIERMKYVKQVTTGRKCLDDAAIRLLRNEDGKAETSSGANEESTGEIATDENVTEWAIEAQTQYGICAKRLNSLIEWFN